MARILRRRGQVQVHLDNEERAVLLGIVDRLTEQAESAAATVPSAYAGAADQAEYARWVGPELDLGRQDDFATLRSALGAGEKVAVLTEAQGYAWLRALNHLRLVAGAMIGVTTDGWDEQSDQATRDRPEYRMLVALGYLQEEIVAALEV